MHSAVEKTIVPMKIKDLIILIMRRQGLDFQTAVNYLYHTTFYTLLNNENTKLWYESSETLYDMLLEEKRSKVKYTDEKIILFSTYCTERYIDSKYSKNVETTLMLFSNHRVYDFLNQHYEMLHTQSEDYIIETIHDFIKNRE